jgi:GNAT superfamily N-acetyltransferase
MIAISDLRQEPGFLPMVANRIWQAWWQRKGTSLDIVTGWVAQSLGQGPVPSVYVAHNGQTFLGTTSVIVSDLAARPELTPWVAAVWVEEEARHQGVGAALVDRAASAILKAGYPRAYLIAAPDRRSFYEGLGWTPIEEGIGDDALTILMREPAPAVA